jgi:hypothetical protein
MVSLPSLHSEQRKVDVATDHVVASAVWPGTVWPSAGVKFGRGLNADSALRAQKDGGDNRSRLVVVTAVESRRWRRACEWSQCRFCYRRAKKWGEADASCLLLSSAFSVPVNI